MRDDPFWVSMMVAKLQVLQHVVPPNCPLMKETCEGCRYHIYDELWDEDICLLED